MDDPFIFSIDQVFHIKDRGVVITGDVISGAVELLDEITLRGPGCCPNKTVTVTGIERQGIKTSPLGLLLREVKTKEEILEYGLAVEKDLSPKIIQEILGREDDETQKT